jgi:hypothetical protein
MALSTISARMKAPMTVAAAVMISLR